MLLAHGTVTFFSQGSDAIHLRKRMAAIVEPVVIPAPK